MNTGPDQGGRRVQSWQTRTQETPKEVLDAARRLLFGTRLPSVEGLLEGGRRIDRELTLIGIRIDALPADTSSPLPPEVSSETEPGHDDPRSKRPAELQSRLLGAFDRADELRRRIQERSHPIRLGIDALQRWLFRTLPWLASRLFSPERESGCGLGEALTSVEKEIDALKSQVDASREDGAQPQDPLASDRHRLADLEKSRRAAWSQAADLRRRLLTEVAAAFRTLPLTHLQRQLLALSDPDFAVQLQPVVIRLKSAAHQRYYLTFDDRYESLEAKPTPTSAQEDDPSPLIAELEQAVSADQATHTAAAGVPLNFDGHCRLPHRQSGRTRCVASIWIDDFLKVPGVGHPPSATVAALEGLARRAFESGVSRFRSDPDENRFRRVDQHLNAAFDELVGLLGFQVPDPARLGATGGVSQRLLTLA